MIYVSDFQQTDKRQELLLMNADFPYLCKFTDMNRCINHALPWHWHTFLELDYIAEGEIELQTPDHTLHLKKGDIFFINTDVLHAVHSKTPTKDCKTYAHLFDMHFLTGMYNSLFERKYFLPIYKNSNIPFYIIHPDSYRRIQMIEKFLKVVELNEQELPGYEFEIRAELCRFWHLLLEETMDLQKLPTEKSNLDTERFKTMLEFIHGHYPEKISLDDIAATANISTRECCRCFQHCANISPMNYLNEYRIHMASQMLLVSEDSITTISENCGFSSCSYFNKIFQKHMNCTPKSYRNKK